MISVRLMNTVRGKRKEETKRMTSPPHVSCYIWCIVITLLTIFGSDQSDANLIERFAQHSSRRFLAGESAASHASYYIPYGLRSLPGDGQRTYTYMALPSDRIFDFVATRYHDRAALSKVKGPMALPGFLAKFDWWISKDKKMRKGAGFMKTTDPTYVLLSAPSLATLLHDLLQHHNVPVDSESVRTLVVGGSDRRSSVYGELVVKELAPWFSKILWEAKDTPIHLYSTPVLTLPIGLTEYYFRPYVKEASAAIAQADVNKKPKLILAAWGAVWNGPKIRGLRSRKRGAQFARENDFVDNRVASHRSGNAATIPKNEYWQTLMQYKFLLYPAGKCRKSRVIGNSFFVQLQ